MSPCDIQLGLTEDQIRNNGVVIRAFDGSKHETLGEVDLNVTIGPVDFSIPFQVMDIHSTYNMLLGRPWIHTAGAVPDDLHQRVKFVKDGKIVIVDAKEDHAVYMSAKGSGNGVHNTLGYREYQIINATYHGEGTSFDKLMVPRACTMMAKEMIGNGYQIGKGLGRDLQGIVEPIQAIDNIGTFGLGFKPTSKDKRQAAQKKADAKMGVEEPMEMEPLSVTFPFSAGVMFEGAHDDSPVPPSDSTMIPDMGLEGLFVDAISIDDGSGPSEINAVTPSQWTSFPLPARRAFE